MTVCVPTGQVDLKVSAEAMKTNIRCGNKLATVPDMGSIDTVVRTLLVEVSLCQTQHTGETRWHEQKSLTTDMDNIFINIWENDLF